GRGVGGGDRPRPPSPNDGGRTCGARRSDAARAGRCRRPPRVVAGACRRGGQHPPKPDGTIAPCRPAPPHPPPPPPPPRRPTPRRRVAGSAAHDPDRAGGYATRFERDVRTSAELAVEVRAGRVEPVFIDPLF